MTPKNKQSFSTGSLRKWFLRLILSGLVIVASGAPHMQVTSSKAKDSRPIDGSKVSLLVEKGYVLPPQPLATFFKLDDSTANFWDQKQDIAASPGNATFTISGEARFENQFADGVIAATPAENGVIRTPVIVAGSQSGEGFIQVMVDGQPIIENLRVATLEVGDVEKLKKYAPDGDPALLASGDHYAVIDETKVTSDEAVTGRGFYPAVALPGPIQSGPTWPGQTRPEPTWPGPTWPGSNWTLQTNTDETQLRSNQFEALGLWIRTWRKPGKVNWHWSDPGGFGYAYKIKPEDRNYVRVNATAPSDDIDGIYRIHWGCTTALKAPDSCTIDWYPDGHYTYCCNAAAWLAEHRPVWLYNLPHDGFKGCPW